MLGFGTGGQVYIVLDLAETVSKLDKTEQKCFMQALEKLKTHGHCWVVGLDEPIAKEVENLMNPMMEEKMGGLKDEPPK